MHPSILTAGQIARELGCDAWKVTAAMRRGFFRQLPKVGVYFVADRSELPEIRTGLILAGYLSPDPA